MGLTFEWTVKLGDILTMGGAVIVAFGIFYRRGGLDSDMKGAVKMLAEDFGEMKEEMKAFSKAISDLAVQRAEINLLMKWYDELRRGVGKIE